MPFATATSIYHHGEMAIITVFETVVSGSSPDGGAKLYYKYNTMKIHNLLEQLVLPHGTKLYHLTEQTNVSSILRRGLQPKNSMRGGRYPDQRLHFIRSLDPELVSEIEAIVLFGGLDMDDENVILTRQDIPVAILELDVDVLQKLDNGYKRAWHPDPGITEGAGLYTVQPIPPQALKFLKTINT